VEITAFVAASRARDGGHADGVRGTEVGLRAVHGPVGRVAALGMCGWSMDRVYGLCAADPSEQMAKEDAHFF
jgi:hypothetical protein